MGDEYEPCTTWSGKLRHLSRRIFENGRGRTLCGQHAHDQASVNEVFPGFGKRVPTIADLSECVSCARSAGRPAAAVVARFDEPAIQALGMLLSLVHYDDLALLWRDMLPAELLVALAASHSTQPGEETK